MTRLSADDALRALLQTGLGADGFAAIQTLPQALVQLAVVRPPCLSVRCRDHQDILAEVHAMGTERLFVSYIRRDVPWLPGEFGRVMTTAFWVDEVPPALPLRCNTCPRNVRMDVPGIRAAVAAGLSEIQA